MRVVSGIQPTGELHIGNYLGAIKKWVELQSQYECFFFIADLHALTSPLPQKSPPLRKQSYEKVMELISLGLDPEQCVIFLQSHVKEHTELAWIFNTLVPVAELKRMTQYKDKSRKLRGQGNAGLLTYPVLQAADILLYHADLVPVGKDQLQHLELTRTLAKKFNAYFGKTFNKPRALITEKGEKIMSLTDPRKKMSKSDNPASYIGLFEEPQNIEKKIMTATTDTGRELIYDPAKKPGISNLLVIFSMFSGISLKDLEEKFKKTGYAQFKKELSDLLIARLEPFRRKKKELFGRETYIEELLIRGTKRAQHIAVSTMEEVRKKIGLV